MAQNDVINVMRIHWKYGRCSWKAWMEIGWEGLMAIYFVVGAVMEGVDEWAQVEENMGILYKN